MKSATPVGADPTSEPREAAACPCPNGRAKKDRIGTATVWSSFASANLFRSQVAKGITFQMLANVLAQASSFLSLLVAARLLGKEQYGRFALVQSTVNTFIGVGALGLGVTATKYVSEYRVKMPERVGRVLGLSCSVAIAAAFVFAAAYFITCPLIVSAAYVGRVRIGAICIFFTALNGYQLGALAGFENFRRIARISATTAFLNPILVVVLTHYFDLAGALTALSFNSFLTWCFYHFAVEEECRRWNCRLVFRGILAEGRCLVSISAPASLSGIVASLAAWTSTLMLSKQSDGLNQMALWSAAGSFRLIVMFIPLVLVRVMMPRLNSLRAQSHSAKLVGLFRVFVLSTAFIAGGVASLFLIFGQHLLALFGKGFLDTDGVLPIVLLSAVIEAVAGSLSQALVIQGRMWQQVFAMASWSLVLVVVAQVTVFAGARGIALANLIAWAVAILIYFRVCRLGEASEQPKAISAGVTNE